MLPITKPNGDIWIYVDYHRIYAITPLIFCIWKIFLPKLENLLYSLPWTLTKDSTSLLDLIRVHSPFLPIQEVSVQETPIQTEKCSCIFSGNYRQCSLWMQQFHTSVIDICLFLKSIWSSLSLSPQICPSSVGLTINVSKCSIGMQYIHFSVI